MHWAQTVPPAASSYPPVTTGRVSGCRFSGAWCGRFALLAWIWHSRKVPPSSCLCCLCGQAYRCDLDRPQAATTRHGAAREMHSSRCPSQCARAYEPKLLYPRMIASVSFDDRQLRWAEHAWWLVWVARAVVGPCRTSVAHSSDTITAPWAVATGHPGPAVALGGDSGHCRTAPARGFPGAVRQALAQRR